VNENALLKEFSLNNIKAVSQVPIKVVYDNIIVGEYYADIFIEKKIILELKVCKNIDNSHIAQLINYLTATNIKVGYTLNFGSENKLQFKRVVK
jgi:GxxExxY protein